MNKLEVQQRVLQDGKPLGLNKFNWCEDTNTFSTNESDLVIDFNDIDHYTFNTGDNCRFNTGFNCVFNTGDNCIFDTGSYCTFNTGNNCRFNTGFNCVFNTGDNCTFKTGFNCVFNTGDNCTFKTDNNCTFNTGSNCTFKTGWNCTFNTYSYCTFNTGNNCTFKTNFGCTFKTGFNCVVIRRDIYQVIELQENKTIQLYPYGIKGYSVDGISETGEKVIIADDILSYIKKQKGNVYRVINHGEDKVSYLIKQGDIYSHGKTLKEAKESLKYKISSRDTSKYEDWNLDTKVSLEEMIKAYRVITGACENGTRYFCENKDLPNELTVKEAIELTTGSFGNTKFKEFF